VDHDARREEEIESRWEAAPAVLLVIVLQLLLAGVSKTQGWTVWRLPWWVWTIPVAAEVALLVPLAFERSRRRLEEIGQRRTAALGLISVVSVANGLLLVALLASLVGGHEQSGRELLFKALTVWATNVTAFGLWFWDLDRGGPVRRREPKPPPPDFQFPQMENPRLAEPGWQPSLSDYMYVSFTNSIAFSPTDAMPLTRRVKALMLAESAISVVAVLLVGARAINILD
jgi:hypothetical protein